MCTLFCKRAFKNFSNILCFRKTFRSEKTSSFPTAHKLNFEKNVSIVTISWGTVLSRQAPAYYGWPPFFVVSFTTRIYCVIPRFTRFQPRIFQHNFSASVYFFPQVEFHNESQISKTGLQVVFPVKTLEKFSVGDSCSRYHINTFRCSVAISISINFWNGIIFREKIGSLWLEISRYILSCTFEKHEDFEKFPVVFSSDLFSSE